MDGTDFAALVRGLMADRAMSAHALARAVPVDAGHLSRVLNGKRPASLDLAAGCDRVFGTGLLLVDAVRAGHDRPRAGRPAAESDSVDDALGVAARRRVLLGGIATVAAAAGLLDVPARDRRLGHADVVRIEAITALYRSMDYEHGGGALAGDVARFAESVTALATRSATSATPALWSGVASARQLAGWTAFDSGRHTDAARHFLSAERTAQAAGDHLLVARIRYCQARQFQHLRHHRDALDAVALARRQLGNRATPAVAAMLAGTTAASLGALGEADAAVEQLENAARDADRIRPDTEPDWMAFYDHGELWAQYARVHRDLARQARATRDGSAVADGSGRVARHAQEALACARRAVDSFAPGNVRSTVLNEVGLASAWFLADEPEQGLAAGRRVLHLAGQVHSRRVRDRVVNLRRDLAKHTELPEVADFRRRLAVLATRPAPVA